MNAVSSWTVPALASLSGTKDTRQLFKIGGLKEAIAEVALLIQDLIVTSSCFTLL